jgi:hypothetical protein
MLIENDCGCTGHCRGSGGNVELTLNVIDTLIARFWVQTLAIRVVIS